MSREKILKTRTSTVSAKQAFNLLSENGYQVERIKKADVIPIHDLKPTYKEDVKIARGVFGENARLSDSGKSVFLRHFNHQTRKATCVLLRVKGMLTHEEITALEAITGLKFEN